MKPNPKKYLDKYAEAKPSSRFRLCPYCGKNIYPDEKSAALAATTGEIVNFDQIQLNIYPCPYGRGYHLSSSVPSTNLPAPKSSF